MAISKAIVSVLVIALIASAVGAVVILTTGSANQGGTANGSGKTFEGLNVTATGATQANSPENITSVEVGLNIANSKSSSVDPRSMTYTATPSNGKKVVGNYLAPNESISAGESVAIIVQFKIDSNDWSDRITTIQCSDSTGFIDENVDIALTPNKQNEVDWYGTPTLDGFYEHEPVWPSSLSHQSMGTWGLGTTSNSATTSLRNNSYYMFNLRADVLISMSEWGAAHGWSNSGESWNWDLDFNDTDSWMMSFSPPNVEVWAGNGGPAHSNQMFQRTAVDSMF